MTELDPANHACLAASYANLGRDEEARTAAQEFLSQSEKAPMGSAEWIGFLDTCGLHFKHQTSFDQLIAGLDKAGLVSH